MKNKYDIDYACLSDAGKIKVQNEDNVCITRNLRDDVLIAVADGVSSQNNGDYASKTVIDYFSKIFSQNKGFFCNFTLKRWLKSNINKINKNIFRISKKFKIYNGISTTLVIALIRKNKVTVMSVGDSRAYLFDKKSNRLQLLSEESNINSNKYKNIIFDAIGYSSYVVPNCKVLKVDDCSILLCSDGLVKNVKQEEIIDILKINDSAISIVNSLIKKANDNGGTDNITVACFIRKKIND